MKSSVLILGSGEPRWGMQVVFQQRRLQIGTTFEGTSVEVCFFIWGEVPPRSRFDSVEVHFGIAIPGPCLQQAMKRVM